jgi:hypothetical protein
MANEIIQLDDGWTVREMWEGAWHVFAPNGERMRTPYFLDKEGALDEYPKERRLYEWESGVMAKGLS